MLIYLSLIEEDAEREKFEMLYDAYRNLMFFLANEILGDTQDSEDVVHQSFLKIIRRLSDRLTKMYLKLLVPCSTHHHL